VRWPARALTRAPARIACQLFACLPLGARVGRTFICHGGLFRKPSSCGRAAAAREAAADEAAASLPLTRLGSLEDLRAAKRGGNNPDGVGATQVAADITWSDPDSAVRLCARTTGVQHACLTDLRVLALNHPTKGRLAFQ
jgi:hypothetical protein